MIFGFQDFQIHCPVVNWNCPYRGNIRSYFQNCCNDNDTRRLHWQNSLPRWQQLSQLSLVRQLFLVAWKLKAISFYLCSYALSVETGNMFGTGNQNRVFCILHGEQRSSETKELFSDDVECFVSGSITTFLIRYSRISYQCIPLYATLFELYGYLHIFKVFLFHLFAIV